jgi:hypothetical protein
VYLYENGVLTERRIDVRAEGVSGVDQRLLQRSHSRVREVLPHHSERCDLVKVLRVTRQSKRRDQCICGTKALR